jgi:hypothetical protein
MIEEGSDIISSLKYQNDLIACGLLKGILQNDQLAILQAIDNVKLKTILRAAVSLEEYELCQLVYKLLKDRDI